MAPKIFVFGSVNGQLNPAFAKLASLHAKNDFSFALVTGNLFAEDQDDDSLTSLLDGTIGVPVTTYFTVGTLALPARVVEKIEKDEDIAPNLHYLGKRSVTKTTDGVRIVTLGGVTDASDIDGLSKEQHLPLHTQGDARTLRGANSADILLTATWPSSVWNGSKVALPFDPTSIRGSGAIADLCTALRPRYHFCPSPDDFFFEREPFSHPPKGNEAEPSADVTRFVSVAPYGNKAKAKAMYAFTLQSSAADAPPPGTTLSPFAERTGTQAKRRQAADDEGGFSRFSHDTGRGRGHNRRGKRQKLPPPGPDQCFLCLASAAAPNHMICSIGNDTYLATAKGPLPSPTTFADQGLSFPAHMLIVPQPHVPTVSHSSFADSPAEAETTFKEMSRLREALQAMVSAGSRRQLGVVTWEISRAANIHAHWQTVPVPARLVLGAGGDLVEAAFRVEAENLSLPRLEARDFGLDDEVGGDFLRVWIWCEEEKEDDSATAGGEGDKEGAGGGRIVSKTLLMRLDENVRFDLQYPRRVMAKLMGLDDRLVWQECVQEQEDEKRDVLAFRKAFEPWDFTLRE
ncbi:CwfJ domain-containing protein [Pleurostoma richardsiae]|uniref:CwfJ domain-containing protein n=1 Tax=Pleurostoma richardsiae TaxID=41990 RepID=A0AA38RSZ7_9PEZI|nr:CwfJ domain-containing protein [Pleurostoma richardsiae]